MAYLSYEDNRGMLYLDVLILKKISTFFYINRNKNVFVNANNVAFTTLQTLSIEIA